MPAPAVAVVVLLRCSGPHILQTVVYVPLVLYLAKYCVLYNVHYVIMWPTANMLSLPHDIIKLRQWRSSSVDVLAAL